jgi:hypothetical protein
MKDATESSFIEVLSVDTFVYPSLDAGRNYLIEPAALIEFNLNRI